jgi:hypothetical protein
MDLCRGNRSGPWVDRARRSWRLRHLRRHWGALFTQTAELVSPDSFECSTDLLLVLVLEGTGYSMAVIPGRREATNLRNRSPDERFSDARLYVGVRGFAAPRRTTKGLARTIVDELLRALGTITRSGGICSIIVERHVQKILGAADRIVILERGAIVHAAASARGDERSCHGRALSRRGRKVVTIAGRFPSSLRAKAKRSRMPPGSSGLLRRLRSLAQALRACRRQ